MFELKAWNYVLSFIDSNPFSEGDKNLSFKRQVELKLYLAHSAESENFPAVQVITRVALPIIGSTHMKQYANIMKRRAEVNLSRNTAMTAKLSSF